jgi:hypothetical protein
VKTLLRRYLRLWTWEGTDQTPGSEQAAYYGECCWGLGYTFVLDVQFGCAFHRRMRFRCHFWAFKTENDIENAFDSEILVDYTCFLDMQFECAFHRRRRFWCNFWVLNTENDIENAFDSETHIQTAHLKRKCNRPLRESRPRRVKLLHRGGGGGGEWAIG